MLMPRSAGFCRLSSGFSRFRDRTKSLPIANGGWRHSTTRCQAAVPAWKPSSMSCRSGSSHMECGTPHPGFSGYITGRATTAGIAAGLAAQVAGHCRYFLTSFRAASGSGWSWRRLPLNWKPPRLDSPSRPGGEAGPDYDEARKRDDRRHEWDSRPTSTSRGTDDADGPLVRRLAAVTNPEDLRH